MGMAEDAVRIGDMVRMRIGSGDIREFRIGDPREAAPERGVISYESPLGKTLIGKKSGDRGSYTVGQRIFQIEVVEIVKFEKLLGL